MLIQLGRENVQSLVCVCSGQDGEYTSRGRLALQIWGQRSRCFCCASWLYAQLLAEILEIILIRRTDIPESQLQTNSGVDMDLMMEGYKMAVARNDGMHQATPDRPGFNS